MQKQKLTQTDIENATIAFTEAQAKKKEADKEFDEKKSAYYSIMNEAFDSGLLGDDVSSFEFEKVNSFDGETVSSSFFKATRVIPTVIIWDINELKKRLSKDVLKKVLKKDRKLSDIQGLTEYVKSLGGDSSTFWSFFDISDQVDQKEMDQASELGYIDDEDVSGCYEVKVKSTSYRVTRKEVEYDEDGSDV